MERSKALIVGSRSNISSNNIESIQLDNIKIFSFLNQPSFSKSTIENYTQILRKFFEFFHKGLSETIAHLALDPSPKAFTKLEELHRSHCDSRDSTPIIML
jgi:hypothetical protein